jgi:hypothetical protein
MMASRGKRERQIISVWQYRPCITDSRNFSGTTTCPPEKRGKILRNKIKMYFYSASLVE